MIEEQAESRFVEPFGVVEGVWPRLVNNHTVSKCGRVELWLTPVSDEDKWECRVVASGVTRFRFRDDAANVDAVRKKAFELGGMALDRLDVEQSEAEVKRADAAAKWTASPLGVASRWTSDDGRVHCDVWHNPKRKCWVYTIGTPTGERHEPVECRTEQSAKSFGRAAAQAFVKMNEVAHGQT